MTGKGNKTGLGARDRRADRRAGALPRRARAAADAAARGDPSAGAAGHRPQNDEKALSRGALALHPQEFG